MLRCFLRKQIAFGVTLRIVAVASVAALSVFAFSQDRASALTTVPATMNFQGRLTDSSGNVVANGSYNMKFTIYNSGSTAIWTETRETTNRVTVSNGLFSVQLGSVTPLTPALFDSSGLTFGITVANPATSTCDTASCQTWETEMTPRSPISTSAYAFNSETLDGLDSTAFAAATGSANYLQNQSSAQQSASSWISGTNRADTAIQAPLVDTATATTLSIGTANATAISLGATGSNITTTVNGLFVAKSSSNSTTAYQIQDSSSVSLFTADTSGGIIRIGSATNGIDMTVNGIAYKGTARPTKSVTLAPEYAGATFTGDGTNNTGTLSSDFCSNSALLNINPTACATAGDEHNYYAWANTQATAQDYDIYVRYRMPADYDTGSMTDMKIFGWGTTSANEVVSLSLYKANATACSTITNAITANTTWNEGTQASPLGACSIAAGDMVTFKVHIVAGQNNTARAGEISFTYKSKL